jgi:hypothetical protein
VTRCKLSNKCPKDELKSFVSNEFVEQSCSRLCPLECNRTRFDTRLSNVVYLGTDAYFKRILYTPALREDYDVANPADITTQRLRESLARIFIFYDSLSYTESNDKTNAGSVLELVASIGGVLNLFMGISVLNVFELLEVLVDVCLIAIQRKE